VGIDGYIGQISALFTVARHWEGWMLGSSFAGNAIAAIGDDGTTVTPLTASPPAQSVERVTANTGYAWDDETNTGDDATRVSLYSTHDAGASWSHVAVTVPEPAGALPLLDFTAAGDGWLIAGGTSWHSTDGGRTWHPTSAG
jgi:photosystem II stability/assembly factor-like uncharacterized protein